MRAELPSRLCACVLPPEQIVRHQSFRLHHRQGKIFQQTELDVLLHLPLRELLGPCAGLLGSCFSFVWLVADKRHFILPYFQFVIGAQRTSTVIWYGTSVG